MLRVDLVAGPMDVDAMPDKPGPLRHSRRTVNVCDPVVHPPVREDGRIIVLKDAKVRPVHQVVGQDGRLTFVTDGTDNPNVGRRKASKFSNCVPQPRSDELRIIVDAVQVVGPILSSGGHHVVEGGAGLSQDVVKTKQSMASGYADACERSYQALVEPCAHFGIAPGAVIELIADIVRDVDPQFERLCPADTHDAILECIWRGKATQEGWQHQIEEREPFEAVSVDAAARRACADGHDELFPWGGLNMGGTFRAVNIQALNGPRWLTRREGCSMALAVLLRKIAAALIPERHVSSTEHHIARENIPLPLLLQGQSAPRGPDFDVVVPLHCLTARQVRMAGGWIRWSCRCIINNGSCGGAGPGRTRCGDTRTSAGSIWALAGKGAGGR